MNKTTKGFRDEQFNAQKRRDEQAGTPQRHGAILEAIALTAKQLMKTVDLGQSIGEVLKMLGQAAEVDRVYVFENRSDTAGTLVTSQRFKWLAPSAESSEGHPELWDHLILDIGLQRWKEELGSDHILYGSIDKFPINERRLLAAQQIQTILIAPIRVKETWWGFIGFDSWRAKRQWSPAEIDACRRAADIIGAALENAQLHKETQMRAQQLAALSDVSHTTGSTLNQDTVLRLTLERLCGLFDAPQASAYVADLPGGVAVQHTVVGRSELSAASAATLPLKTSLTGQVIITGRPVFIEKRPQTQPGQTDISRAITHSEAILAELPTSIADGIESELAARAAAIVPLAVGEHVLGTLNLAFDAPRSFSDDDKRLLAAIGRQAGIALANARLFQETVMAEREARRRADQLGALYESTRIVNASLDLEQTLNLLLEQLIKLVPYDSAAVVLHEDERLRVAAGRGFPDLAAVLEITVDPADSALLKQIVETRQPVVLADMHHDESFQSWCGGQHTRSCIGLPMLLSNKLIGILTINSRQAGVYDDESARLAQALADQTAVAIYKIRLLDDLQRANRELRQLDGLKGQFIQNVAHELRTPLTLVRGYIELLAEGNLDIATQQSAIRAAFDYTATLVRLVESITTLHDMSMGELAFKLVQPLELISTALQLATQKAIRADIDLQTDCPPDLPAFSGDFIWLSQALYQLLDNAIKFSPDGGTVTLRLRGAPDQGEVQISVEDQGIGVAPDEKQRIFDLFYQADGTTTRRFGGTGLGLAIVQRVVRAHGGRLSVESPVDQDEEGHGPGSRFVLCLPINQA